MMFFCCGYRVIWLLSLGVVESTTIHEIHSAEIEGGEPPLRPATFSLDRIGLTAKTIEHTYILWNWGPKLAFQRQQPRTNAWLSVGPLPQVVWYRFPKATTIAKFGFRNRREEGMMMNNPTKFDLVGSNDCAAVIEKASSWETVKALEGIEWTKNDEEKSWEVGEEERKSFLCYGIRFFGDVDGVKNVAVQDLKMWKGPRAVASYVPEIPAILPANASYYCPEAPAMQRVRQQLGKSTRKLVEVDAELKTAEKRIEAVEAKIDAADEKLGRVRRNCRTVKAKVSATSTVANETTTDLTEAKKHLEKANGWLESTLERLRQIRAQQQQDLEIIATLPEEADVGTIGRKIKEMRQRIEERRRLRH